MLFDRKCICLKNETFLELKLKLYINQLLSTTHDIYKSFDEGYEVRGVFLDISKTFDKVWYDGIIFKLKQWKSVRTFG